MRFLLTLMCLFIATPAVTNPFRESLQPPSFQERLEAERERRAQKYVLDREPTFDKWERSERVRKAEKHALEQGVSKEAFSLLWNMCQPVGLLIDSFEIGENELLTDSLTIEDIAFAVRSRLRSARLYDGTPVFEPEYGYMQVPGYVEVDVMVIGTVAYIDVGYYREYRNMATLHYGSGLSWEFGTLLSRGHYDLKDTIINDLQSITDQFVDQYLGANDFEC